MTEFRDRGINAVVRIVKCLDGKLYEAHRKVKTMALDDDYTGA